MLAGAGTGGSAVRRRVSGGCVLTVFEADSRGGFCAVGLAQRRSARHPARDQGRVLLPVESERVWPHLPGELCGCADPGGGAAVVFFSALSAGADATRGSGAQVPDGIGDEVPDAGDGGERHHVVRDELSLWLDRNHAPAGDPRAVEPGDRFAGGHGRPGPDFRRHLLQTGRVPLSLLDPGRLPGGLERNRQPDCVAAEDRRGRRPGAIRRARCSGTGEHCLAVGGSGHRVRCFTAI